MKKLRRYWDFLAAHYEGLIVLYGFLTIFFMFGCWLFSDSTPHISYADAKYYLEEKVIYDNRVTLYCEAPFNEDKEVEEDLDLPDEPRMNWEHAVTVSEFGRNFPEWTEGHPECVRHGKPYRGRKCAEKVNPRFQQMQADMYNLFPAVSAMNAARSNREYAELPQIPAGMCGAKMVRGKFEPPDHAKGQVARAALYMDNAYEEFSLKPDQKLLFHFWDEQFPVNRWECTRAKRIEKIQKKANPFVKNPCKQLGLW